MAGRNHQACLVISASLPDAEVFSDSLCCRCKCACCVGGRGGGMEEASIETKPSVYHVSTGFGSRGDTHRISGQARGK